MTGIRTAVCALVAGSAITISACRDDDSSTTGPGTGPEEPDLRQALAVSPDPLVAHARAIPGFGGFFLDPSGRPTVYLKGPAQRGAAQAALRGALRELGKASAELRVLKGDYDYLQLHGWFTLAEPEALTVPGAVFADLDEGSNRLRIGVESGAAGIQVRAIVARLGIPSGAIVVEQAESIHPATTLRHVVKPRRGGLRITSGDGQTCTLGFNTVSQRGLIVIRSFITNSHCTNVPGGVEATKYYQPFAPNLVGTEASDPAYFTGSRCPWGRKCRYSDAARVKYESGVSSDLGGITRTTYRGTSSGSILIDAARPFFNITAEASPVQGATVNKVGQTTGWTYGAITGTCVSVNLPGTNITYQCQSKASGRAWPGDSGSPVFYWGGGSNVGLVGVLWGFGSWGGLYFSPMSGIQRELGALKTF